MLAQDLSGSVLRGSSRTSSSDEALLVASERLAIHRIRSERLSRLMRTAPTLATLSDFGREGRRDLRQVGW